MIVLCHNVYSETCKVWEGGIEINLQIVLSLSHRRCFSRFCTVLFFQLKLSRLPHYHSRFPGCQASGSVSRAANSLPWKRNSNREGASSSWGRPVHLLLLRLPPVLGLGLFHPFTLSSAPQEVATSA